MNKKFDYGYLRKQQTLRERYGRKSNTSAKVMNEDIIRDNRTYDTEDIDRYCRVGDSVTDGSITSFVEIRDDYDEPELYRALTSSYMRVCINLHHRDQIQDRDWYLMDNGVEWFFDYRGKRFCFVSTHDSFDVFVSPDRDDDYIHVIHADHSHCTNAQDINTILEADTYNNIQARFSANAHPATAPERVREVRNAVREAVRDSIRNEVAATVRDAVRADVRGNIDGELRGGVIDRDADFRGGDNRVAGNTGNAAVGNANIDRIVDAVFAALRNKIQPNGNTAIRTLISAACANSNLDDAQKALLLRVGEVADAIIAQ